MVVFDECHKAKNLSLDEKVNSSSKAAKAVVELQQKLPLARVVYVSATGASHLRHITYMCVRCLLGKVHDWLAAFEQSCLSLLRVKLISPKHFRTCYVGNAWGCGAWEQLFPQPKNFWIKSRRLGRASWR